jgi:hypothetical protein
LTIDASDVAAQQRQKKARCQQDEAVDEQAVDPDEVLSSCGRMTRNRAAQLGLVLELIPRRDDDALTKLASMISGKVIKNVVVLAGAGISTNAGIRDFRTPGELPSGGLILIIGT